MRIIYFFGRLDKNNERDYLNTVGLLAQYGIYDILPYDVYERGFRNKFTELLATPLTKESLQKLIDKRQEEQCGDGLEYNVINSIILDYY